MGLLSIQLGAVFPGLVAEMGEGALETLTRCATRHELEPGDRLENGDEPLDCLVLVLRGRFTPEPLAGAVPDHRWVLGAGEVVGAERLAGSPGRLAALESLDGGELLTLDREAWAGLIAADTSVAAHFLRFVAGDVVDRMRAVGVEVRRREEGAK